MSPKHRADGWKIAKHAAQATAGTWEKSAQRAVDNSEHTCSEHLDPEGSAS